MAQPAPAARHTPASTARITVIGGSLIPHQHRASRGFRRSCDLRCFRGLKFPGIGEYHSHAEYLHACLIEGEPAVTAYVPQPFLLGIGRRRYTPDVYVVRAGERWVYELKPRGEFEPGLTEALTVFFRFHGMHFGVIANEAMLTRQVEAVSIAALLRLLRAGTQYDTSTEQAELYTTLVQAGEMTLAELLADYHGVARHRREVALGRMVLTGQISAALADVPFGYNTVFQT